MRREIGQEFERKFSNMTGSSDDRTTISASMSGAPSLANSLNSFASCSKLSQNSKLKSQEPEENVIADLLEKAKFYTSLCLGECVHWLGKSVVTKLIDCD